MNSYFHLESEYSIDNDKLREKLVQRMPSGDKFLLRERTIITKEAFLLCYNAWIKQSKEENENVTSETSNE